MSRQHFNDGMEVIYQDLNNLQVRRDKSLYDGLIFELIQKKEDAFFGDSHKVNYSSNNAISINAGLGFQTDAAAVAPEPSKKLLGLEANLTLNIVAPDTVNDRIDIVVAKWSLVDGDTDTRKFKNATSGAITDEGQVISKKWESTIEVIAGTPDASPVAPATPAGYILLAELSVAAVSGLADQSSVEDKRNLMPLGALATINGSAFGVLTQGAEIDLQTLFTEIDILLLNGVKQTNVYKPVTSVPDAPATANERVVYNLGGQLFVRESQPEGGAIAPLGSGAGGGGGGAEWIGDALEIIEFNQPVFKFSRGTAQKLTVFQKIPSGYLAGREITANLGFYSPSASDNFKMNIATTLIRKGQDTVDSVANINQSPSDDFVNDNANEFRQVGFSLTDAVGKINGFSASPGDLIKIELTRIVPAGTDDTAEIRMIPASTEVKFG